MSKLTPEQIEDAVRLKHIYSLKAKALGVTQEAIGVALGDKTQSAVANYMGEKAKNALNIKAALVFARMLDCWVEEFSPSLAKQIDEMARYYLSTKHPDFESLVQVVEMMGEAQRGQLMAIARTFLPRG